MADKKVDENALISSTSGRARIKGLDLAFTSASEINKNHAFGDEVVDAVSNQTVRLPGKPSYDPLTLTTPYSIGANKKIVQWLKTTDAAASNVAVTLLVSTLVYTFTKCSLSKSPVSPGFDANGNQAASSFLTLVVEVTNTSVIEIK